MSSFFGRLFGDPAPRGLAVGSLVQLLHDDRNVLGVVLAEEQEDVILMLADGETSTVPRSSAELRPASEELVSEVKYCLGHDEHKRPEAQFSIDFSRLDEFLKYEPRDGCRLVKVHFSRYPTTLTHLTLSNARVRSVAGIGQLKMLEELDLSRNAELDEPIGDLAHLQLLRHLDISRTALFGDLECLPPTLQIFNASRSDVFGDLAVFEKMSRLQVLDLSFTLARGPVQPLQGCLEARILNLKECRHISGDLTGLENLTRLVHLDVSSCFGSIEGTGEALRNLTSLEFFAVAHRFQGPLDDFTRLTSLRRLVLAKTACFSEEGFDLLGDLACLEHLEITGSATSGTLDCCESMRELAYLELHGVTGSLAPLSKCLRLKHLSLLHQLTGDLSPLRRLTLLETLKLSVNLELEGSLEPLSGLRRLRELSLVMCSKLDGNIAPLAGCRRLEFLTLDHCLLLHGNPKDLDACTRLRSFRAQNTAIAENWEHYLSTRGEFLKIVDSSDNNEDSFLSAPFDEEAPSPLSPVRQHNFFNGAAEEEYSEEDDDDGTPADVYKQRDTRSAVAA